MKISPYIWVPNLWTIHTDLVRFLMARAVEGFTIDTNIKTWHDVARNRIVKWFLDSKCTHLWWIDSDIVPWENFIELFKANEDIVVGSYPIRQDEKFMGCYHLKEGWEDRWDLIEVDRMWLGMCVIKREVVEAVVKEHWMFCETQIMPDWLCSKSEDIVFAEWAQDLWYKIWLHKEVISGHTKMINFWNLIDLKFNN